MRSSFVLVFLLVSIPPASAAPPQEPLVEQVRKAIDKAKEYLIGQRTQAGDWERDTLATARPGGPTALTLLALLNAGVEPNDPVIKKGLDYLKKVPQKFTYVVALRTMVLCRLGDKGQQVAIEEDVNWLIAARLMKGGQCQGWSYEMSPILPDASNTQYALLGLHEAQLAGIAIKPEVWKSLRDYYVNTQTENGGYGYQWNWEVQRIAKDGRPSFSMTTAGLCGLIIAGNDLNAGRETPRGDGTWNNCGNYEEDRNVLKSLEWMGQHFPVGQFDRELSAYYCLYGIERAGRLTGMRFIGKHDWYRVGCEWLVAQQQQDGSWLPGHTGLVGSSIVNTSFALLFLSKGRTPILVSKLKHGLGNDWNNDRNDARHLVEFASRNLFKNKPMGWQVFNAAEADSRRGGADLAAELLQSPIAYFNGHEVPTFSGKEKDMLREFIGNGGLILAEACCGRKEFDQGFRKLMSKADLFADEKFSGLELKELDENHAVWTAAGPKFAVSPRDRRRFPLWGVEMGCKTVVIYSPNDLSCRWESNQFEDKGDNQAAFNIGANIIAYATGLEPPQDRLTPMKLKDESSEPPDVPRGFLKAGLLIHEGDFKAAHEAMPNLLRELRTKSGLDVSLKVEEVDPTKREVLDYRFLYMHGRKTFSLPKDKLDNLRFNLEHGGLLFADACCGSDKFDESFRQFIAELWPKGKLERIPVKDALFGEDLNGTAIASVRCRRKTEAKTDTEYQNYEPFLEGVKIGGRWVVIYSRWDIGCALEKHKSPNCMGHDYDSAVRLGRAAVLYHLSP